MSDKPTIDQMNEAIGVFMGYKMYDKRYPRNHGIGAPEAEPEKCMIIQNAKYHTSWDWLMPVVEKIEQHAHVCIRVGICAIEMKFGRRREFAKASGIEIGEVPPIAEYNDKDFIGNVFHAVYDFIQWYNKQKQ